MISKGKLTTIILLVAMLLTITTPAFALGGKGTRMMSPTESAPKEVPSYAGSTGWMVTNISNLKPAAGLTKEQMLAQELVGSGIKVSNVKYTGGNATAGTFNTINNIIGFNSGVVLSTGTIQNVVGPNSSSAISCSNGYAGDSDLDALIPGYETYDATILEFDFIPKKDTLSFKYVFASDEYNEYVNNYFNDVFGFFLNGVNVAFVPGTTTPVSINNINGGNPLGTAASNSQYYRNNDSNSSINTEMDGLTTLLTVTASVVPNKTNHIKLAIADAGDDRLDSNVFLMADSFSSIDLTAPDGFFVNTRYKEAALIWNQVSGAEYYNIYRCQAHLFDFGGGDWQKIGSVDDSKSVNGRCIYYDNTGVPDVKYHYLVKAVRGLIEGPASKTITVATPLLTPPGGIKLSVSGTDVTVKWKDNEFSGFNIFRLKNGDSDWVKVANVKNQISYIDRNLSPNTKYFYALTSVAGTEESKWSSSYSITTKECNVKQILFPNGMCIYVDQKNEDKMATLIEKLGPKVVVKTMDYGLSKIIGGTKIPIFSKVWGVVSFGKVLNKISYENLAIKTFAYTLELYETQEEGLFWEMLDDNLEDCGRPRIDDPKLTIDDIMFVMRYGNHFAEYYIGNLQAELCPVFKAGIGLAY